MERIWKYVLGEDIPAITDASSIVRFDKVDGQWCVWVRVKDKDLYYDGSTLKCEHAEIILPIAEDYEIELPFDPTIYKVVSENGFIKLKIARYYDAGKDFPMFEEPIGVRIKMLKTGAEVSENLDEWLYLGFGYIYIQQELGLHVYGKLAHGD